MMIQLAEQSWFPDSLIRVGIRRLLMARLKAEQVDNPQQLESRRDNLIRALRESPVAIDTAAANEQHYEVPAGFFQQVLGPHLKYSCAYWPDGVSSLQEAEAAMLALTCERALLADGQRVLELGCGWGSLTLWMAQHYPGSQITAISNSHSQREYIEQQARRRGLDNVRVITADMNDFSIDETFDRVVSVEMFEHMRNYAELMKRIAGWLVPGGMLFVHIFCHRNLMYPFETEGDDNWMGRYFFTGGIMPSFSTLVAFQEHLNLETRWKVNGRHYQETLEAWLQLADQRKKTVLPILEGTYGRKEAARWLQRWRIFFMACSELFGYRDGEEWFVGHYRFVKPD